MPYAKMDEEGRMVQWSHDRLDGLDVEFSNGEYIDENCVDGLEDFVIENGEAVYRPLPEKEIKTLAALKKGSDEAMIDALETLIESLASATTLLGLFSAIKKSHEGIEEVIEKRKAWRDRINELEE